MPQPVDKKVCLMGACFDTGNMGVSALAASLIKMVVEAQPSAELFLFIGNRSSRPQEAVVGGKTIQVNMVNYRLSPKAKLGQHLVWIFFLALCYHFAPWGAVRRRIEKSNPCICALRGFDFIGDIRGGDSFSDIYGLNRFIMGSLPAVVVLLLDKKLTLLPQTIGPFKSGWARMIARYIVSRAHRVFVRDRASMEVARELLAKSKTSRAPEFCPDVALTMDAVMPAEPDIQPPLKKARGPLVGLNVNGLLYNGGYSGDNMFGLKFDYKTFISELIQRLMKETDAEVLLIPHTYGTSDRVNSDPDACMKVQAEAAAEHRERLHCVMTEYNQHEVKGVIGTCDFFVGSRMHACIAALSQAVPAVGVAYSRKFVGVFDSLQLGHMVMDACATDRNQALAFILDRYRDRDQHGEDFARRIQEAKGTIKNTFRALLDEAVDASEPHGAGDDGMPGSAPLADKA